MNPSELPILFLQLAALLAAAVVMGRLAARLGLPTLVGEIFAGVILGPIVLGHLAPALTERLIPADHAQTRPLDVFTHVGVLLLVAITGAQLDVRGLRQRGSLAFRVSLGGLLVPLALGVAAGFLLPAALMPEGTSRVAFALFIGVAMCVSAIPVIAKALGDLNLLHRNVGQLILAAAVFDDAVGWLLLSLVSAMAVGGIAVGGTAATLGFTALFLVGAWLVGRPLARRALRAAERNGDAGPTIAIAVIVVLCYSTITGASGMEPLFGAFVAGASALGLADPVRLAPLRTIVMAVFAPIFLASVGLRIDLMTLAEPRVLVWGLILLVVATAGKFAGAYLGGLSGRLGHWERLALGAGMNSRGMIEVIIALAGLRMGVLSTAMFTIVVLIAIVTSLISPLLLRAAARRIPQVAEERARERRLAAWSDRVPARP